MTNLPQGFRLAVASADFRNKNQARNDVALVLSDLPVAAAGVFTTNLFRAAPVLVAQEMLAATEFPSPDASPRAVLINSGQANACTGQDGLDDCRATLRMAAEALNIPASAILPASTGVIGARMNLEKWRKALPSLAHSLGTVTLEGYARAIMTTDAFPKMAEATVALSGGEIRLAGAAKGAGMICPNMATMLSVVMCDVAIAPALWQAMFRRAVDSTFNRVSVDGDTSTNDSLFGLANGASHVAAISPADLALLEDALTAILHDLAYMLVRDGEGATKVMHITVTGAATDADADAVARTVGHSQLVKTAMFGCDPNWGRIVAAAGRAGVAFNPNDLRVVMCGVELFRNGQPTNLDFDTLLREPLDGVDIALSLSLGSGPGSATLLASDLSHGYVTVNADYRS